MSDGPLSDAEIAAIGFRKHGRNLRISRLARFYGAAEIEIGDNVRIDDFCILSAGSGGINIGSNIHIAAYSSVIGAGAVLIDDFANISSRVSIYSSNDDYTGQTMTGPMVQDIYKNVDTRPVRIGRHSIIGCGTVILPGVNIGDGTAIGALSLVRKDCADFGIYAGAPARKVGERQRDLLKLEQEAEKNQQ